MAWEALYKWFSPWRKTPYINWIAWYQEYLAKLWWESLTPEEREKEQKAYEERKQKERDCAVRSLQILANMMSDLAGNRMNRFW